MGSGDKIISESASGAYQAMLGCYLGQMRQMGMKRKEGLVDVAKYFAYLADLNEPPELNTQMVGKMGLEGVAGINVVAKVYKPRGGGGGGGRGGCGGRG